MASGCRDTGLAEPTSLLDRIGGCGFVYWTLAMTGISLTIRADGTRFRDRAGRHVILRGVNLGGDCKVPTQPNGHTYLPTEFADHRTVSFVGRPFPLDEADAHFARLQRWGFNCLRLLTTWEAVEHAGPGDYDEAILS